MAIGYMYRDQLQLHVLLQSPLPEQRHRLQPIPSRVVAALPGPPLSLTAILSALLLRLRFRGSALGLARVVLVDRCEAVACWCEEAH